MVGITELRAPSADPPSTITIGTLSALSLALVKILMVLLKQEDPFSFLNFLDFGVMDSSGDDSSDEEFFEANHPLGAHEAEEQAPVTLPQPAPRTWQQHLFGEDGSLSIPTRAIVVVSLFAILLFFTPAVETSPVGNGYDLRCGSACKANIDLPDGITTNSCCYVLKDNEIYSTDSTNGAVTSEAVTRSSIIKVITPKMGTRHTTSSMEQQDKAERGDQQGDGLMKSTTEKALHDSATQVHFESDESMMSEKKNSPENPKNHTWNFSRIVMIAVQGIDPLFLSYKIVLLIIISWVFFCVVRLIGRRNNNLVYNSAIHEEL